MMGCRAQWGAGHGAPALLALMFPCQNHPRSPLQPLLWFSQSTPAAGNKTAAAKGPAVTPTMVGRHSRTQSVLWLWSIEGSSQGLSCTGFAYGNLQREKRSCCQSPHICCPRCGPGSILQPPTRDIGHGTSSGARRASASLCSGRAAAALQEAGPGAGTSFHETPSAAAGRVLQGRHPREWGTAAHGMAHPGVPQPGPHPRAWQQDGGSPQQPLLRQAAPVPSHPIPPSLFLVLPRGSRAARTVPWEP